MSAAPGRTRTLTDRDRRRYLRQIAIPRWGEAGQERIARSTVFVAGAGGLGSAVLLYLVAAGVGRLRICDAGRVELSNLNRQVLYRERDLGAPKTRSARRALSALNRSVRVETLAAVLTERNAADLVGDADIMIDCLDNLSARMALNAHAVRAGLPLVHAGVGALGGQLMLVHPPETACLACALGSEPAEPAAEAAPAWQSPPPVLGAAAGVLGCLEALEALAHLAGIGAAARGRMLLWDGAALSFETVRVGKDPRCPVCGPAARSRKEISC